MTALRAAVAELPPLSPMVDLTPAEQQAFLRRRAAHAADIRSSRGPRDTRNLALDDTVVLAPWSLESTPEGAPLLAIDGDPETAWRGSPLASLWVYNLPFQRAVHLSLIRSYFGDASNRGVPSVYRWEYRAPEQGACKETSPWQLVPNSAVDDRDPNQFVNGPKDIHVRRQALFTDIDACALRLVISVSEGGPPVVRDLRLLEGARSVTHDAGVRVMAETRLPAVPRSSPEGAIDGRYETLWAGRAGRESWTFRVELPVARTIDRISLSLGLDAVTVRRPTGVGRRFSGAYLPLRYSVETSPDEDLAHLCPVEEADPPALLGEPLPTRRRLVHLRSPRAVKTLQITVTEATGISGESDSTSSAPVIRDIGLYEESDKRPVITEPLFLSVNANPSALTHELKWGEEGEDADFARTIYHRLRRSISGFDTDTGWPADASRRRDLGRGKFLEAIEGDDPLLAQPLLEAIAPPPVVFLSGSLLFEFSDHTARPPAKSEPWAWNVFASGDDDDHGMGQLIPAIHARVAPFIGFCGGAHILGLFEAKSKSDAGARALIDTVLVRNVNQEIGPLQISKLLYERAWWYDPPRTDSSRPSVTFDKADPLFATLPSQGTDRRSSLELPLSHIDMIREPAFDTALSAFRVSAYSEYCRPWVSAVGPEPVSQDPEEAQSKCVRVPQAFRTTDPSTYPIIGFQFHPEQRDLTRLGPGSVPDARGDAMNIFANAIDLVLDSYVRVYWPGS